jgi:hypothetical protein
MHLNEYTLEDRCLVFDTIIFPSPEESPEGSMSIGAIYCMMIGNGKRQELQKI